MYELSYNFASKHHQKKKTETECEDRVVAM